MWILVQNLNSLWGITFCNCVTTSACALPDTICNIKITASYFEQTDTDAYVKPQLTSVTWVGSLFWHEHESFLSELQFLKSCVNLVKLGNQQNFWKISNFRSFYEEPVSEERPKCCKQNKTKDQSQLIAVYLSGSSVTHFCIRQRKAGRCIRLIFFSSQIRRGNTKRQIQQTLMIQAPWSCGWVQDSLCVHSDINTASKQSLLFLAQWKTGATSVKNTEVHCHIFFLLKFPFCFFPCIDAPLNQFFFFFQGSLFLSHFTSPSLCLSLGGSLSASLEFYLSNLHPLWQPSVPPYNPPLLLQADLIKQSFSVMRKGAKGSASGWATIQRKLIVKKTGTHGHLVFRVLLVRLGSPDLGQLMGWFLDPASFSISMDQALIL